MIDWHCHILPAVDDGAASTDESVEMARILGAAGFTRICCTPHRLRGMYDTEPEAMRRQVRSLQLDLDRKGVGVTLLEGMEYCLDEFFVSDFTADPVTLGGTRYVLVETPSNADPRLLRENIFHLVRNRYVPLLAHPERHAFLAPPPRSSTSLFRQVRSWVGDLPDDADGLEGTLVVELKEMGCAFQGNLGSVAGYYGSLVRAQEQRFRQENLYSCYGSDGHNASSLEQLLEPALAQLGSAFPTLPPDGVDRIAP